MIRRLAILLLLCVASVHASVVHQVIIDANTAASPRTTGAFTPTAGDLLVACVGGTASVATAPTMTDTQNLGWDLISTTAVKATSADTLWCFISRATAAATSTTATFTATGDATTGQVIQIWGVSGMGRAGLNALRQAAKQDNQAASTTPAPVFSSAALTGNPIVGMVFNATNPAGMTPPGGTQCNGGVFTEDGDAGYITPTTGGETVHCDSGFTGTTVTWGSTSASIFCSIILELDTSSLPSAPAVPAYVQWRTSPLQNNVSSTFQKMRLPNPSPGGNLLLVVCAFSSSASSALPTITDDHTNTWSTAISVNDGTNLQEAVIFYAMNSVAGTSLVTATWGTATSNNVCWLSEVRNIAASVALDGTAGQISTSATPTTGTFATINNGSLIIHFVFATNQTAKRTFTAGTGFALRQVDDWTVSALQSEVLASAGQLNPSITSSASQRFISIAAGFKPAAAGNDLASGIKVRGLSVLVAPMLGALAASMSFQVPTNHAGDGNLLAVNWVDEDVTNPPTSITSSPANTFTNVSCAAVTATSTMQMRWVYVSSPSLSSDMTITFAYASIPSLAVVNAVYEIKGASTTPFDTCANASGNLAATSGTVTGPNLTPTTSNGLVVAAVQQSGDTVTAVPSPTGANMDNGDWGIYTLITADQDGGYMNYLNPTTAAVQVNWTYSAYETPATNVGNWGSQAVAFKASSGGAVTPHRRVIVR